MGFLTFSFFCYSVFDARETKFNKVKIIMKGDEGKSQRGLIFFGESVSQKNYYETFMTLSL
jgi:hypothetical protein